jgi:hypothetical protein
MLGLDAIDLPVLKLPLESEDPRKNPELTDWCTLPLL